jgi:hypothetical protein
MFWSRCQNENRGIKTASKTFDSNKVHLIGNTIKKSELNSGRGEIRSWLNPGYAFYHALHKRMSLHPIQKSKYYNMVNYKFTYWFIWVLNSGSTSKLRTHSNPRKIKMTVFWDLAPCSLVETNRRFRDAYCLHHQCGCPDDWGSK